ncbi:MAG: tyrosine-type recombinase/integrase [Lachnospiraceae bacterium]|nr:tyrosine-type recombinase/integrase [Lachnospiraceae bacterium]
MEVDVKWDEHDKRWVARKTVTYKGVKFLCKGTSVKSKADARESWQRAKERKIAEIDGKAEVKAGKIKLKVALPKWYDDYKRNDGRNADTIRTNEDTIEQIKKVLGEKNVCDIDSDTIQSYFNLLASSLADNTIDKYWCMLHMFFAHLYPDGGNPMARCVQTKSKIKTKSRTWKIDDDDDEPTDMLAYTPTEMKRLAAELAKPYNVHSGWHTGDRGYSAGLPVVVCMYQFLRVGEVVQLRVKDILWNDDTCTSGYIWVRRQYDENNKVVKVPKYNSKRKVPIMVECVDILRKACDGKQPNDLLFQSGTIYNPDKTTHEGRLLRGRLRDNLNKACERTGLERHTIHDLRHDGISRLVDMGVRPQSVQRWAGHKSLSVTLDKYYRHNGEDNAADLALISGDYDKEEQLPA